MKLISIVIPAYNEGKNIPLVYAAIEKIFKSLGNNYDFEIMFVNDGSRDNSFEEIKKLAEKDARVKYINFSRNFGKEIATTAGINNCAGDACIMIDADLQHPAELIPEFIKKWEAGADVVVGIRKESKSDSELKKIGSRLFYKTLNRIAEMEIVPNSTDFRLIDRKVIEEFKRFTERGRMTRALIDWLGFRRDFIYFDARERINGTASYNFWKLAKLALDSFVSLSLLPLRLAGYLGIFIMVISGIMGTYIMIGKYFLHDAHGIWHLASTFSDAENLAIFIVFLVGIILVSLGLMALYVANIHREVIERPIYVIKDKKI